MHKPHLKIESDSKSPIAKEKPMSDQSSTRIGHSMEVKRGLQRNYKTGQSFHQCRGRYTSTWTRASRDTFKVLLNRMMVKYANIFWIILALWVIICDFNVPLGIYIVRKWLYLSLPIIIYFLFFDTIVFWYNDSFLRMQNKTLTPIQYLQDIFFLM